MIKDMFASFHDPFERVAMFCIFLGTITICIVGLGAATVEGYKEIKTFKISNCIK